MKHTMEKILHSLDWEIMINEFSHLNEKKILVTGSNGFVGRHLIKKLKELKK